MNASTIDYSYKLLDLIVYVDEQNLVDKFFYCLQCIYTNDFHSM